MVKPHVGQYYNVAICLIGFLLPFTLLFANDKPWQNEIDLGMLMYNGNNNAKHLNGSLLSEFQQLSLDNSFKATGLLAVGKNTQTKYKERNAEKYTLNDTIQYTFSPRHFAYLSGQGVRDHFSAYTYEFTESMGYGYNIFDKEYFIWQLSGGPGTRQSKVTAGPYQNEWIGHLESELFYEITSQTSFKQSIVFDRSTLNTKSRTVNELKTALFGPLAAKMIYELEHYSHIPPQSKFTRKTDITTKITLSYSF